MAVDSGYPFVKLEILTTTLAQARHLGGIKVGITVSEPSEMSFSWFVKGGGGLDLILSRALSSTPDGSTVTLNIDKSNFEGKSKATVYVSARVVDDDDEHSLPASARRTLT
jgi:hypothetical protein